MRGIKGLKRAIIALAVVGGAAWGGLRSPEEVPTFLAGAIISYGNLHLFELFARRLIHQGAGGGTIPLLLSKSLIFAGLVFSLLWVTGNKGIPFLVGCTLLLFALPFAPLFEPTDAEPSASSPEVESSAHRASLSSSGSQEEP